MKRCVLRHQATQLPKRHYIRLGHFLFTANPFILSLCLLVMLTVHLQRAHVAPGCARFAYRATMRDEVEVEGIV